MSTEAEPTPNPIEMDTSSAPVEESASNTTITTTTTETAPLTASAEDKSTTDTNTNPSTNPSTNTTNPTPQHTKLINLVAKAQKAYSQKDYTTSSELFAEACELQAQLNGSENHPSNAFLLYLYGKSLFNVAVSKSDVLGGATAKETGASNKKKKGGQAKPTGSLPSQAVSTPATSLGKIAEEVAVEEAGAAKKPFFSFQGDENWDDSDEEAEDGDEDGGAAGQEEEEDDDFALAWDIVDLARVLYEKRLNPEKLSPDESYEPASINLDEDYKTMSPEEQVKRIKTQLSDCYDILGEISLESENFTKAVEDLQSSLNLKLELLPIESRLISEAHFKLSLALEFAAAIEGIPEDASKKGREDAASQMEKAIESCRTRLKMLEEEVAVTSGDNKGKAKASDSEVSKSITEAKEIVAELEQRLHDLRMDPIAEDATSPSDPIKGLLGQLLGQSPAEAKNKLNEAMKNANDVTGLVRKKKAPENSTTTTTTTTTAANGSSSNGATTGKRKLDDVEDVAMEGGSGVAGDKKDDLGPKKAKVEDATDEEERAGGSAQKKTIPTST